MRKSIHGLIVLSIFWGALSFAQNDSDDGSTAPVNVPSQKESPTLDSGNYSLPESPPND